jgi:hypothetical protein
MPTIRSFERPKRSRSPIFILAALAMMLSASSALAQTCLQDVYGSKKLNCVANDVSVAEAVNVRDLSGKTLSTCFAGTKFSFIADFNVVTTATARENIGLYMALNGQASALKGSCTQAIISPLHDPGVAGVSSCSTTLGVSPQCLGSALYHEYDTSLSGDNCGDTTSADGTNQFVTIEIDNIVCPAVGSTFVLPNCTSWQQPGGAMLCESPPDSGWPWAHAAIPGSPSKCNCSTISVPITPIAYSMTVTKVPDPESTPEPGGDFTFTVGVDNTTSASFGATGSEIITQVCDDKYGNIGTISACSGGTNNGTKCTNDSDCGVGGTCISPKDPCPAGSLCSSPNNVAGANCAKSISCALPQTVPVGTTVSDLCSFTATITGSEGSYKDTATVNGFGNTGTSSPPAVTGSDQATVTLGEGPATAQVTKSIDATAECATVRYQVEVQNTSDTSSDETETLSALNDNPYGDITKTGGTGSTKILGTTCGVATTSKGLGTLSGSYGAGALPATIAPGANYTCEFDGQFCGSTGPLAGCADNLEQKDTVDVSETLADDDGEDQPITGSTSDSLTVDVCFTATH